MGYGGKRSKVAPVKVVDEATVESEESEEEPLEDPDMKLAVKETATPAMSRKQLDLLERTSNVVYISGLPDGFEEVELRKFLMQFGLVKRIRVPRSLKTGRARGYAFIQFAREKVAEQVVAEMNGYLINGKVLHAELKDPSTVKPAWYDDSALIALDKKIRMYGLPRERIRQEPTTNVKRLVRHKKYKERMRNKQLQKLGIACTPKFWNDAEQRPKLLVKVRAMKIVKQKAKEAKALRAKGSASPAEQTAGVDKEPAKSVAQQEPKEAAKDKAIGAQQAEADRTTKLVENKRRQNKVKKTGPTKEPTTVPQTNQPEKSVGHGSASAAQNTNKQVESRPAKKAKKADDKEKSTVSQGQMEEKVPQKPAKLSAERDVQPTSPAANAASKLAAPTSKKRKAPSS